MTASDATFGDSPGSLWMPVILTESTLSPGCETFDCVLIAGNGGYALGAAAVMVRGRCVIVSTPSALMMNSTFVKRALVFLN